MNLGIKLRPLQIEDVDNVMTWVNDPKVVFNFQNFDMKITREAEIAYLEKILTSNDDKLFAVETENRTYLGNAGLHGLSSKNRLGRVALIIGNKKFWGKGYGQNAMRELIKYAFDECRLNKIWLIVDKENEKARHIYEKVGFKIEGILEEEYADRTGKFHDMIRMRLLRREYMKMKNSEED